MNPWQMYPGRRGLGQGASGMDAAQVWREYYIVGWDFTGSGALAAAASANALPNTLAFTPLPVRILYDWELCKWTYIATDPRVYVNLNDDGSGRYRNTGALDARAVFGLGAPGLGVSGGGATAPAFFPFIYETPDFFHQNSVYRISAADFSGAGNTVRVSAHGNKVHPGVAPWRQRAIVREIPHVFAFPDDSINFNVSANATITFSAQIDSGADFLVQAITGVRQGAATIQLQSEDLGEGAGGWWMDRAVHVDNLIGNGVHANKLPSPRFIPARTSIVGIFADLSAATNQMRLYFYGKKLYYG